MKTEYKFGLDKNRRELTYYQSPDWLRHILSFKKSHVDQKGENNSNAKIEPSDVIRVRELPAPLPRRIAAVIAGELGVAVSYIYQLRKWENGKYKKWPHLTPASLS